ncbi:MAG TPA: class I SAM-dependent methyltransferase [Allosphingosinicella sp.]
MSQDALLRLLGLLSREGYGFVTPTPATHARILERSPGKTARDLRDMLGWNLPFERGLAPELEDLLAEAGALERKGGLFRSRLRVSSVGERLFLHSSFPTEARDSVFFGPDTYRFVDFIRSELPRFGTARRLLDIGTGSGAGAIMAAPLLPGARLTLLDINPAALRLAAVNARHAGLEAELVEGGRLDGVAGVVDLVVANPPYIIDDSGRDYRDGGDMHGARLSLDWTLAAARRLEPGGHMLLYTGSAIVEGRDHLREALERELAELGCTLGYREIDPDLFGEELERPVYREVERIAAVGAVVEAPR